MSENFLKKVIQRSPGTRPVGFIPAVPHHVCFIQAANASADSLRVTGKKEKLIKTNVTFSG